MAALCLMVSASPMFAQSTTPVRAVVVGELVGRRTIDDLKIMMPGGFYLVSGAGNGKPFRITDANRDQIAIRFNENVTPSPVNPNTIKYRFYESERALISALILEEIDFAVLEHAESALEVQRSNLTFRPVPVRNDSNKVKLVCYNNRSAVLRNKNVRIALSYGIDHGAILKMIANKAHLAHGPFDEDSPLYNSGMESYRYQPKKAVALLKRSGWDDSDNDRILEKNGEPFVLPLYYSKGVRLDEAISREIKLNLFRVGIDVEPRGLTKQELLLRLNSGDFQAILMDYTFKNSVESLEAFFAKDGPDNYMGYNGANFEKNLKFYYGMETAASRKTLIQSLQKIINADQPVTFLYFKWLTHYVVNINKFDNYLDSRGNPKPFVLWRIK
jgi:ABC-type oligopeptide transport system substrate-binding subunit